MASQNKGDQPAPTTIASFPIGNDIATLYANAGSTSNFNCSCSAAKKRKSTITYSSSAFLHNPYLISALFRPGPRPHAVQGVEEEESFISSEYHSNIPFNAGKKNSEAASSQTPHKAFIRNHEFSEYFSQLYIVYW